MNKDRKTFLMGAASGAGVCLLAAAMIGMTEQPGLGGHWITSSPDGRTAYLWDVAGGRLNFVASAQASSGAVSGDGTGPGTRGTLQS